MFKLLRRLSHSNTEEAVTKGMTTNHTNSNNNTVIDGTVIIDTSASHEDRIPNVLTNTTTTMMSSTVTMGHQQDMSSHNKKPISSSPLVPPLKGFELLVSSSSQSSFQNGEDGTSSSGDGDGDILNLMHTPTLKKKNQSTTTTTTISPLPTHPILHNHHHYSSQYDSKDDGYHSLQPPPPTSHQQRLALLTSRFGKNKSSQQASHNSILFLRDYCSTTSRVIVSTTTAASSSLPTSSRSSTTTTTTTTTPHVSSSSSPSYVTSSSTLLSSSWHHSHQLDLPYNQLSIFDWDHDHLMQILRKFKFSNQDELLKFIENEYMCGVHLVNCLLECLTYRSITMMVSSTMHKRRKKPLNSHFMSVTRCESRSSSGGGGASGDSTNMSSSNTSSSSSNMMSEDNTISSSSSHHSTTSHNNHHHTNIHNLSLNRRLKSFIIRKKHSTPPPPLLTPSLQSPRMTTTNHTTTIGTTTISTSTATTTATTMNTPNMSTPIITAAHTPSSSQFNDDDIISLDDLLDDFNQTEPSSLLVTSSVQPSSSQPTLPVIKSDSALESSMSSTIQVPSIITPRKSESSAGTTTTTTTTSTVSTPRLANLFSRRASSSQAHSNNNHHSSSTSSNNNHHSSSGSNNNNNTPPNSTSNNDDGVLSRRRTLSFLFTPRASSQHSNHSTNSLIYIPKNIQDSKLLTQILQYYRCLQFKSIIISLFKNNNNNNNTGNKNHQGILETVQTMDRSVIISHIQNNYTFLDLTLSHWLYIFTFIDFTDIGKKKKCENRENSCSSLECTQSITTTITSHYTNNTLSSLKYSCKYFHAITRHPYLLYQYLIHYIPVNEIDTSSPHHTYQQFKYMILKQKYEKTSLSMVISKLIEHEVISSSTQSSSSNNNNNSNSNNNSNNSNKNIHHSTNHLVMMTTTNNNNPCSYGMTTTTPTTTRITSPRIIVTTTPNTPPTTPVLSGNHEDDDDEQHVMIHHTTLESTTCSTLPSSAALQKSSSNNTLSSSNSSNPSTPTTPRSGGANSARGGGYTNSHTGGTSSSSSITLHGNTFANHGTTISTTPRTPTNTIMANTPFDPHDHGTTNDEMSQHDDDDDMWLLQYSGSPRWQTWAQHASPLYLFSHIFQDSYYREYLHCMDCEHQSLKEFIQTTYSIGEKQRQIQNKLLSLIDHEMSAKYYYFRKITNLDKFTIHNPSYQSLSELFGIYYNRDCNYYIVTYGQCVFTFHWKNMETYLIRMNHDTNAIQYISSQVDGSFKRIIIPSMNIIIPQQYHAVLNHHTSSNTNYHGTTNSSSSSPPPLLLQLLLTSSSSVPLPLAATPSSISSNTPLHDIISLEGEWTALLKYYSHSFEAFFETTYSLDIKKSHDDDDGPRHYKMMMTYIAHIDTLYEPSTTTTNSSKRNDQREDDHSALLSNGWYKSSNKSKNMDTTIMMHHNDDQTCLSHPRLNPYDDVYRMGIMNHSMNESDHSYDDHSVVSHHPHIHKDPITIRNNETFNHSINPHESLSDLDHLISNYGHVKIEQAVKENKKQNNNNNNRNSLFQFIGSSYHEYDYNMLNCKVKISQIGNVVSINFYRSTRVLDFSVLGQLFTIGETLRQVYGVVCDRFGICGIMIFKSRCPYKE